MDEIYQIRILQVLFQKILQFCTYIFVLLPSKGNKVCPKASQIYTTFFHPKNILTFTKNYNYNYVKFWKNTKVKNYYSFVCLIIIQFSNSIYNKYNYLYDFSMVLAKTRQKYYLSTF